MHVALRANFIRLGSFNGAVAHVEPPWVEQRRRG
jgi:hypothetical protein